MTAIKPVLEVYIDTNIVLVFAWALWLMVRAILCRGPLRNAYPTQLRLLKALMVCVALSPLLALAVKIGTAQLMPGHTVALSDVAVAAFLRGDISMTAAEFEELLNTRVRLTEGVIEGHSLMAKALLGALAAGAAVVLARAALTGLSIRRLIADSHLWRRTGKVDVRFSDRVSVPFAVRGLTRRYIIVPSHLVAQARDARFILAHEFQHLRQGDTEWEIALEFLRPLFFWNPAFGLWKREFDRLRELSCDQVVVARRGVNVRDYLDCILDFCAQNVAGGPKIINVALVRSGAKRALKGRVLALQAAPSASLRHPFLQTSLFGVFLVAVALGAASIRQPQDWSHDRLMLSTVVNLERLEAINRRW